MGERISLASPRFNQRQHETERKRFEPDARLPLVVERMIQNAVVQVKEHINSTRGIISCELGQSLITETVLALNQIPVQPLIRFNAKTRRRKEFQPRMNTDGHGLKRLTAVKCRTPELVWRRNC